MPGGPVVRGSALLGNPGEVHELTGHDPRFLGSHFHAPIIVGHDRDVCRLAVVLRGSRRIVCSSGVGRMSASALVGHIRHCWVTDRHGRLPALLLEW